MVDLSVIIIVKDSEKDITYCLESVRWADEIIILDSGSQDNTIEICRRYTPHVYLTDWPGFGVQKNRALKKTRGNWILSLDADEILSPDLIEEIKTIVKNPQVKNEAYAIKRVSFFLKKRIQHGDWRSDKVVRLFRRSPTIYFSDDTVHERLMGYHNWGILKHIMFHNPFKNVSQILLKLENYSTCGAKLAYRRHKSSTVIAATFHGAWCFIRGYFLRFGFLDGREGFILAVSNAAGVFYRYIKLIYYAAK